MSLNWPAAGSLPSSPRPEHLHDPLAEVLVAGSVRHEGGCLVRVGGARVASPGEGVMSLINSMLKDLERRQSGPAMSTGGIAADLGAELMHLLIAEGEW